MIACVSSFGTNIYYFPQSTKKWTKMKIKRRPSRQGETLKWHKNGNILVTASNPKGDKPGNLSMLSYDTNYMCFNATKVYECAPGEMISSVRWNCDGTRLAVALYPSSQILFFNFDKTSATLSQLGFSKCAEFPAKTRIVLECHSELDYMFACATDVASIKVWSPLVPGANYPAEDDQIGLMMEAVVKVASGQCGMEFNTHLNGLFTFEKGMWRFWSFNELGQHVLTCLFEGTDEHYTLRRRFRSTMISFASSKRRAVAASGGSNDSMVVHKKAHKKRGVAMDWEKVAWRNRNVCSVAAKCLKFNPKDDLSMRVAMGGDSGYIHIWAVYEMNSSNVAVTVPDRHNEDAFYNKSWNPENANLASTSSGDEDDAGDDEVDVEKAWEEEEEDEEEDVVVVDDDDGGGGEDEDEDKDEDRTEDIEAPEDDSKQGVLHNVGATVGSEDSRGQKRIREKDSQGQKSGEKDAIGGGSGSASGAFEEITNDARGIADRIEADNTVSPQEMLDLCRKILKYSSDIGQQ